MQFTKAPPVTLEAAVCEREWSISSINETKILTVSTHRMSRYGRTRSTNNINFSLDRINLILKSNVQILPGLLGKLRKWIQGEILGSVVTQDRFNRARCRDRHRDIKNLPRTWVWICILPEWALQVLMSLIRQWLAWLLITTEPKSHQLTESIVSLASTKTMT